MFAGQCPRCCTPLIKSIVKLETDQSTLFCEEQVFLCVQCKKVVVASSGNLETFFERSQGSLVLLTNPFEVSSSWVHVIREKIIE